MNISLVGASRRGKFFDVKSVIMTENVVVCTIGNGSQERNIVKMFSLLIQESLA